MTPQLEKEKEKKKKKQKQKIISATLFLKISFSDASKRFVCHTHMGRRERKSVSQLIMWGRGLNNPKKISKLRGLTIYPPPQKGNDQR